MQGLGEPRAPSLMKAPPRAPGLEKRGKRETSLWPAEPMLAQALAQCQKEEGAGAPVPGAVGTAKAKRASGVTTPSVSQIQNWSQWELRHQESAPGPSVSRRFQCQVYSEPVKPSCQTHQIRRGLQQPPLSHGDITPLRREENVGQEN